MSPEQTLSYDEILSIHAKQKVPEVEYESFPAVDFLLQSGKSSEIGTPYGIEAICLSDNDN